MHQSVTQSTLSVAITTMGALIMMMLPLSMMLIMRRPSPGRHAAPPAAAAFESRAASSGARRGATSGRYCKKAEAHFRHTSIGALTPYLHFTLTLPRMVSRGIQFLSPHFCSSLSLSGLMCCRHCRRYCGGAIYRAIFCAAHQRVIISPALLQQLRYVTIQQSDGGCRCLSRASNCAFIVISLRFRA